MLIGADLRRNCRRRSRGRFACAGNAKSVLGTLQYWHCVNQHEHGEDDEVQASKSFGQSFIVARESTKPVKSAKAALDHPSAG